MLMNKIFHSGSLILLFGQCQRRKKKACFTIECKEKSKIYYIGYLFYIFRSKFFCRILGEEFLGLLKKSDSITS